MFLSRRLWGSLLALCLASIIVFAGARSLPGDPPSSWMRRVDPSMSVKRKVTVPEGKLANEGPTFVVNTATFGTTFDAGVVDLLRVY